jgi:hypothetical protein
MTSLFNQIDFSERFQHAVLREKATRRIMWMAVSGVVLQTKNLIGSGSKTLRATIRCMGSAPPAGRPHPGSEPASALAGFDASAVCLREIPRNGLAFDAQLARDLTLGQTLAVQRTD